MTKFLTMAAVGLLLAACGPTDNEESNVSANADNDLYIWLEDVQGEKALDWVNEQNKISLARLETDPRFDALKTDAEKVLTATDRIPYGTFRDGYLYNHWQDETHVRGLWRRASFESYSSGDTEWETVLDFDKLAEAEGENWVYKGVDCKENRCMIRLSRGGGDAVVVREFDTHTKSFPADGFTLPEAKSSTAWLDADTILVGTDFGDGTLTSSGYARQIKMLHRGQALTEAQLVYEASVDDMGVFAGTYTRPEGDSTFLISLPSFFENDVIHVAKDGTATHLPLPRGIDFKGIIKGDVVIGLRDNWVHHDVTYAQGSVLSMPLDEALSTGAFTTVRTVFTPDATTVLDSSASLHMGKSSIFLPVMNNVIGRVLKAEFDGEAWTSTALDLPQDGTLSVVSVDDSTDRALVNYDSFLTPDSLYALNAKGDAELIKSLPARFDASNLQSEQHWATSKDGTKVPYFIISPKGMPMNGQTPTLLYGYGGFEISLKPGYASVFGQGWLKQGGVYVIANIRGGGEFGPAWHQAALLENRQRAYHDFIAVAEHLIDTGVTSPRRLGIMGGSNGGLLMGAMFTQRPDLFEAVICAVPLLDMVRYNKLLAGASWMGEYGNPDIPEQREYILKYSPYQNLRTDTTYPEIFFTTSTMDDRVHPGHARKMTAKMLDMGNSVLYFENTEGGHSAAANLKQRARLTAIEVTYLLQKLKD